MEVPNVPTNIMECPNYVYSSVEDLTKLEVPENSMGELAWCRTVGILQSYHSQVYVCDINSTGGLASDHKIPVSMAYLKAPQYTAMFQSIVMPCPAQIFGSIKWHSMKAVLYAKLVQVLSVPRALQLKDTMDQLIIFKSHGSPRVMS